MPPTGRSISATNLRTAAATCSSTSTRSTLVLERAGDVLTINGEAFNFGPLPECATLPAEAIDSDWFAGPVERINGVMHLTLVLPHGPDAPETTRFPAPLVVDEDELVAVRLWSEREEEHDNEQD